MRASKKIKTTDGNTSMTPDMIAEWIDSIGFPQYSQSFSQHDIDEDAIKTLSVKELQTDLGIASLGHRKRIRHEIQSKFFLRNAEEENEETFHKKSKVVQERIQHLIAEESLQTHDESFFNLRYSSSQNQRELSWASRSLIIFYLFHPLLGNRDCKKTAQVFDVNSRTVNRWLHNRDSILKWYPIVRSLKVSTVLEALPPNIQQTLPKSLKKDEGVDLSKYQEKYHLESLSHDKKVFYKNSESANSSLKQSSIFVSNTTKRIAIKPRVPKYLKEEEFLVKLVKGRAEKGDPLSRPEMIEALKSFVGKSGEFYKNVWSVKDNQKRLSTFIRRALERSGFSIKQDVVCAMNNSTTWKEMIRERINEMNTFFHSSHVEEIISVCTFHLPAYLFKQNKSCTVILSMGLISQKIYSPLVIMDEQIPEENIDRNNPQYIFTKNGWVNEYAFHQYMNFLRENISNTIVGLLCDEKSIFNSNIMKIYCNENSWAKNKLIVGNIDGRYSSIFNPMDYLLFKTLRKNIYNGKQTKKKEYHQVLQSLNNEIEQMNAVTSANEVSSIFDSCGFNIFSKDRLPFMNHLSSIDLPHLKRTTDTVQV